MVETAKDRSDGDSTVPDLRPWCRRLEAEAAMGAIVVLVVDELGQDRAQVALAEGYQVVEAIATDGVGYRKFVEVEVEPDGHGLSAA